VEGYSEEVEVMVHLHLRSTKGLQSQLVYVCKEYDKVKDRSPLRKWIKLTISSWSLCAKDQQITSSATYEYSQFSVSPQFFRMSLWRRHRVSSITHRYIQFAVSPQFSRMSDAKQGQIWTIFRIVYKVPTRPYISSPGSQSNQLGNKWQPHPDLTLLCTPKLNSCLSMPSSNYAASVTKGPKNGSGKHNLLQNH